MWRQRNLRKLRSILAVIILAALLANIAQLIQIVPNAHGSAPQGQLHVFGNRLVDANGNQVRLVGLNYGEHPAGAPDFHSPSGPAVDAGNISKAGFNAVNLVMEWGRLETSSYTYTLDALKNYVQALTHPPIGAPLYVIIKLHADADCDSGSPPCTSSDWIHLNSFLGANYCDLDPSVPGNGEAFASRFSDNFYNTPASQGNGMDHLTKLWRAISSDSSIYGNDHVIGYDLINEPTLGTATTGSCHHVSTDTTIAQSWHSRVNEIISDLRTSGGNGGDGKVVNVELAPFFSHQVVQQTFGPFTDSMNNNIVSFHYYEGECNHGENSACPVPTVSGSWTACTNDEPTLAKLWSNVTVSSIPSYCHPTNLYITQLQITYPNQAVSVGEFGNIYYQDSNNFNQPWNLNTIDIFNKNVAVGYFYWSYAACLAVTCSPAPCNNQNCGTWIRDQAKTPVWPAASCLTINYLEPTRVGLFWDSASTLDSAGIKSYNIMRNNVPIGSIDGSQRNFQDSSPLASPVAYQIQALDINNLPTIDGPIVTNVVRPLSSNDFSIVTNSPCPLFSNPDRGLNGGSASSLITLSAFGLGGSAGLSSSVSPTGANVPTITLSANSVPLTPGSPSTIALTGTVKANTPGGTYVVTVTATCTPARGCPSTITRVVSLYLMVANDFAFAADPTTVFVSPGGSSAVTGDYVTSIDQWSGTVTLTAVSFNSGITAHFMGDGTTTTVAVWPGGGQFAWLQISASQGTPQGNYFVIVQATSPSIFHSASIVVVVGSGGSVLAGTLITLSNGTRVPVQTLRSGMQLRSYNVTTHRPVNSTVTRLSSVTVNNYLAIMTTAGYPLITDQRLGQTMYVVLPNATWALLPVNQLQVGYYLFQPETGTLARITQLYSHTGGSYVMYDIYSTDPHNNIADTYLNPQG